jgi:DNA-binding GntR family transcriptional regulator
MAFMADLRQPSSILPRTRAEAITAELRRAILAGEFAARDRLRQAEIAERYGVSTTPVREAFTALAREGLVRQDAHRGVVVFSPSMDELTEIYEIRRVLEPLATRLAASALSDRDLADIGEIVQKMAVAEPDEYVALNQEFHGRIYSAAGKRRVQEIISNLRETSASYTKITARLFDQDYHDQVQAEHEGILEALQSRSARRAARLVKQHLENNERHVAKLVDADPQ